MSPNALDPACADPACGGLPSRDDISSEGIAAVVESLRREVCFDGETYLMSIDSAWLLTPQRRYILWGMIRTLHSMTETDQPADDRDGGG
jgi:hypothetical protein